MFTVDPLSDPILHNEKYIILFYILEIFLEHGAPEKKIRHEKVTRPCIPPHGFFSSQFDVFCEELIPERPNSSLKNPCGGIHGL